MVDNFKPRSGWSNQSSSKKGNGEPAFVPPDRMAQSGSIGPSLKQKSDKPKAGRFKSFWKNLSPKKKILVSLLIVILVGALGFISTALFSDKPTLSTGIFQQEPKDESPKTEEPSKLTGLMVPLEVNKRPVIGVMIENSPDARPQSGLREAGVVYEAVAEAGITRFLALYQDSRPSYVGPVRSARPYYLRWDLAFDAPLAHVGGSAKALEDIRRLPVKDLDQFANASSYQRVSSRYAPHNVYTSIIKLMKLSESKGWKTSEFSGFERKAEEAKKPATVNSISFNISSANYKVSYTYSPEGNSYLRKLAGRGHVDERSGKQINPKVVIAIVTDKGIASDDLHSEYRTNGTGRAYIFQDGGVMVGSWKKHGDKSQIIFKDDKGAIQKLNPGQTWITVVADKSQVSYSK